MDVTEPARAPAADRAESGADAAQAERRGTSCGLLMLRLGRAAGARIGAALGALDMHPHEYALLHALADGRGASQAELAAALRVHPSNFVALVDGLEAEGFLDRTRDPADRRRHLLELTPAGRERLARAEEAVAAGERELLAPLSDSECARLERYLERLAARACAVRGARRC